MAVRTKLLASGRNTSATAVVVYTVPLLETAIVKQIVLFNINTTTATTLQLLMDTAANNQTVWAELAMASRLHLRLDMWQVLQPGMEIALANTAAVGVNYWISGTELEGVAD